MTSPGPRVSVVLATYNRRGYLVEALESLMAQTYMDWEVIVGNDGGPAHIDPVKERFVDTRISWVDHPARKGLLGNTLDGFRRARGRFIAILQDDDRWAPELLATLVPALEADPSTTVSFCDTFIIDESGEVDQKLSDECTARWGRDRLAAGMHRPFRRLAVEGTIPIQCAAVFRRDALDVAAFPRSAGTKFDRWLSRELARGDAGAWYGRARLSYYRSHSGQQTATGRLENMRAGIYIFQRFLEDPELADVPRRPLRRALAEDHYGAATCLIREGRCRESRRHLAASLRSAVTWRAVVATAASFLPSRLVCAVDSKFRGR